MKTVIIIMELSTIYNMRHGFNSNWFGTSTLVGECWASVEDCGPALNQYLLNVSREVELDASKMWELCQTLPIINFSWVTFDWFVIDPLTVHREAAWDFSNTPRVQLTWLLSVFGSWQQHFLEIIPEIRLGPTQGASYRHLYIRIICILYRTNNNVSKILECFRGRPIYPSFMV